MISKDLHFVSKTFAPGSRGEKLADDLVGSASYPSRLAFLVGTAVNGMDAQDPFNGYWAKKGVTVFFNAAEAVGYGAAFQECAKTLLEGEMGRFEPVIDMVDPGTKGSGAVVLPPANAEAQDRRLRGLAAKQGYGFKAYVLDEFSISGLSAARGAEIVSRAYRTPSILKIRQKSADDSGDYLHPSEKPLHRRAVDHALVVNGYTTGTDALARDMRLIGDAAARNMLEYCDRTPSQLDYFRPR